MNLVKRLLAIVMLSCLGYGASAQAGSITVINKTRCNVYYQLLGQYAPSCAPAIASTLISQAGPSTVNYPPTFIGGWPAQPPTVFINGARIFSGPTSCASPIGMVGQPCSSLPLGWGYATYTTQCIFCTQLTVIWTPAPSPGGNAVLTFS